MCSFPKQGTINASQTAGKTPTSRYGSEQSERGKFSHFCIQNLLLLSLFLFVLQIFCQYNMTFNSEIFGRGDDNTHHPIHLKYWGIYPPIPPPPRDRHPCLHEAFNTNFRIIIGVAYAIYQIFPKNPTDIKHSIIR